MTITSTILLTQSIAYPVIGQAVTLGAYNVPAGRRIRWRLMSAPPTSALELYSARNELCLDNGLLEPDIEGKYILQAVEEEFVSYLPHFAGDTRNGYGPVEDWEERAYSAYNVYVGCKMTRDIGMGQDMITLSAYCHDTDTTHGVLTSFYDSTLAPSLSNPTSDRARLAMGARPVQLWLAAIGGYGYWGSANYLATDGTDQTFLHSPFAAGLLSMFLLLVTKYEQHLARTKSGSHTAADTDVIVTAAATNEATLVALANGIKSKYEAHRVRTSKHKSADTYYTITSADATNTATAITLLNEIRGDYEGHRDSSYHEDYGDGSFGSRVVEPECWDEASAILLANDLKSKVNHHFGVYDKTTTYHKGTDADNKIGVLSGTYQLPNDESTLVYQTNLIADYLHAHAQNIKWSDKSSASYHHIVDASTDLTRIPRASNATDVVPLLEYLCFALNRHSEASGPHALPTNSPGAGSNYLELFGTSRLHLEFLQAVYSQDLGAPTNALTSQQQLLAYGGFTKG